MLEGATCGTRHPVRCRRRAPRQREEGCRGEAPWPEFTNLIDAAFDLPMQEKNASPEKDGTECTNKPERWFRVDGRRDQPADQGDLDRKSTRLNSSHLGISYAVFCLKKK